MGGIEPPLQPSSLQYPLVSKCDPAKLTSAKNFMPKINLLESKSPKKYKLIILKINLKIHDISISTKIYSMFLFLKKFEIS
jgi:hypothetical protein